MAMPPPNTVVAPAIQINKPTSTKRPGELD